jgi:ATP-dependent Lon protease
MNNPPSDSALRDRVHIIEIQGYTNTEKAEIVLRHTLPKTLTALNLKKDDITIKLPVIKTIINKVDSKYEKGVRNIERVIKDLVYKINFSISTGNQTERFGMSFKPKTELSYPVEVDMELFETFCKDDLKEEDLVSSLYL